MTGAKGFELRDPRAIGIGAGGEKKGALLAAVAHGEEDVAQLELVRPARDRFGIDRRAEPIIQRGIAGGRPGISAAPAPYSGSASP